MFVFCYQICQIGPFEPHKCQAIIDFQSTERTMIAATVFAYSSLSISTFIDGRYSVYDRFIVNGHATNGQKYVSTATNGN